jgi:hypothetical protein
MTNLANKKEFEMGNLKSLLPRIIGFLTILIVFALAPNIISANGLVTTMANGTAQNITNFIALSAIHSFASFLIIMGLFVSGGLLAIAGNTGKNVGMKGMLSSVISIVVILVLLTLMPTIITYGNTAIAAAIAAGDTITQLAIAIVVLIVYLGVIASSWTGAVAAGRSMRKGSKKSSTQSYL